MSVDGIRDTTEAFAGKRVRFTGTVDRVLGSRVLIFKDKDPMGKEHLLGITRRLGEADGVSAYFWGSEIRDDGYLARVRAARAKLRQLASS